MGLSRIFIDRFIKEAMDPHTIETYTGSKFDTKQTKEVQKLVDEQTKKRFALRHPYLTGIPTLFQWPLYSEAAAATQVTNKLMEKSQTDAARMALNYYLANYEADKKDSPTAWTRGYLRSNWKPFTTNKHLSDILYGPVT